MANALDCHNSAIAGQNSTINSAKTTTPKDFCITESISSDIELGIAEDSRIGGAGDILAVAFSYARDVLKVQGVLAADGSRVAGEALAHVMPLPVAEPVEGATCDSGDLTADIGFLVLVMVLCGRLDLDIDPRVGRQDEAETVESHG